MTAPVTIVWNFGALREGGGRSVGHDFLEHLAGDERVRSICVVDRRLLDGYCGPQPREVIAVHHNGTLDRILHEQEGVPSLATKARARAVLSVGNYGPYRTTVPHGVFVHTPYLAYPSEELVDIRRDGRFYFESALGAYFAPLVRTASGFAVQTRCMKERFVQRWNVPPSRVRIIAGSTPASVLQELRRLPIRSKPQTVPLAVTASVDSAHKNLDLIPQVSAELQRRGTAVRFALTLAPQSPGAVRLVGAATRLGVKPNLTFVGRLTPLEMARLLRDANLAFLPSLLETLGLPYLEAQAASLPICASDRPFAREVCGERAVYFDPLDAKSAADAVEVALKARPSSAGPEEAGRSSADVIRDFVDWALELAGAGSRSVSPNASRTGSPLGY